MSACERQTPRGQVRRLAARGVTAVALGAGALPSVLAAPSRWGALVHCAEDRAQAEATGDPVAHNV